MADNAQPADVGTTVPVRMPDGTVVAMPTHPTPEQYQKIADLQAHFNPPKELTDTLASDMATQEQETNAGPAHHVEAPTAEEIHTAQTQPDLYNPKWAENYLATGVKSGKLYEKALAVREADAQREFQQQANLVPQAAAPTVENSAKLNQPVQLATHIEDWQPTPEATPGTVIGSLIDSAGLEAYKIWNGMMLNHLDSKKVGDITSAFPRSQQEIAADEQKTAELKSNIAEAENIQANSTPFFNNKTGETMYGVARGFTDYAPEMGAFMIDPALGVTAMAGAAGFGGYGKYRARGATPEQAALGGTLEGSIMAATSALPMGYITKNIGKTGIEQFTGSMIERGIAPLTAQSVAMSAVDTGIANPDKTWGQWAGELPDTIKQAALSALIFTGAASTLHMGARGIKQGFGIADLNQTKIQQATAIDNITDPAKNVDQAIAAAQQELNNGPSVADQLRAIRPIGEDHGTTGLPGAITEAPGGAGVGGADTEGSVANAVLGAERSVSAGRIYANLRAGTGVAGAEQGAPEVQPVAGETARLQTISPMGPEARAVPENTLEQRQSQEDRDRFDTLYTNAVNLVAKNGSASVPLLQRNLVVPWGRAERIIQKMQDDGIVGEPNIAGQRPILQMPSWVTETAIPRPVIEKGTPIRGVQIARGEQNASEKPSTTAMGEQPSGEGSVGRTGPAGMERGQPGAEPTGALPGEAAPSQAERTAGAGEQPGAREVSQLTPKQQALLDQEQAALRQGKGINAIPEQYALEEHPRATPDFSIGQVALERAKTAAVRADIAINRALGGEPEETLSARAEREKDESRIAAAGRAVLNAAIPGHTERALQATAERRRAAGLQFSVGQAEPISVDGVHRPALNSDGKPIHPTTEGTKNFWRWFGNSKVVDEQGRPQVMYHGTTANIDEFKPRQANAIFMTPDKETANEFTQRAGHENEPSGNVIPAYVKAEHPFDPDNKDDIEALRTAVGNKFPKYKGNEFSGSIDDVAQGRWMALENPVVQNFIRQHYDGFYVYEHGSKNLAVYNPAQIKSALGNVGAFSRERPQIQFSVAQTETPEFKAWSDNLPVVKIGSKKIFSDGEGVVVEALHGTTGDFTTFEKERADPESDMGAGFYFTNNPRDVSENYAGEGPDLTQRIQILAGRIASETDRDYSDPDVIKEAKEQLSVEHGGMAMPVYVRMRNPAVIGGAKETRLDLEEHYDEETDSYDEPTGKAVEFIDALRSVAPDFEDVDIEKFIDTIYEHAMDRGGIDLSMIFDLSKARDSGLLYATDHNGNLASNEVLRRALEYIGYDGIIDQTVNAKFGSQRIIGKQMEGMDKSTVHFVAFNPEQIKSSIGNRGTFERENANILQSRQTAEQQRAMQSPEEAMATLPSGMRKAAQLMTERANAGKPGGIVIGNEEQNMRRAAEMLAAKHGTTVSHEWGILEAAMRSGEAAGEKPVDLRERRDLFMKLPSEARQRLTEELSAAKREGGHNVDAYQVDLDMLSDILEDEGKNLKTYPAYHNFTYEGMPVTSEFTAKPKINGFYHPDIGTVFVNLDKVTPEEFKGVVAHEINHAANDDVLNREVMKRLEGATGDDIYGRVNARLERAGQSGNPREATSYLLEEAMNMGRTAGHSRLDQGFFGWAQKALPDFVVNTLKKWVAAVRAALYRSGIFIKANDLTVDDFVAINQASMRALALGELEPAQAEAAQPSVAGKPAEQAEQHIGKMSALMGKLKDTADAIADDFKMAVAPMAAGKTDAYRAIAKDYANAERIARWQWTKFDEVLKKNYTEDQLKEMWDAADEQNVLLQQGLPTAGKGLDRLTPEQRETMDVLHQYGESLLQRAKDTGMFKGEGLPYWTPRIAAVIGEDGEYMRPTTGAGGAKEGRNVTVSSPNLKQRKYLTAAETEEAMKAKFGDSAQIVRNIRAMPMAMERLERAVAGRELINQIKQLGAKVGEDLVSINAGDGYFTLDHPAFKTYRPRMVEVDGKMTPAEDQNGNMIFDKVPLYMRDDLKGPIKAILSQPGGKIYNALMSLKGRAMSVIMYSPLIHNAVEFGRALPIMPGKMLTFRMYFDGNKAKNDPVQMRQAIADGMVPIGHRGGFQDISGMMEGATIQAGRSLTAKATGGGIGLLNKAAGEATKRGIDTFGDLWHNTLLWDRVGDLQMGLYVNLKRLQTEKLIKQGLSQEAAEGTAGKIAAHMANRYAGALPNEAMSAMTRKLTNLALFSRSFTMGNLGVMKDIATGLPKDVQAQIVRDYGELALRTGKDIARRKALAAFVMDIGLMYAMTSLTQDAFDMLKRDKSLSAVEHGYADRLSTLLNKAEKNPLAVLNSPLDSLQSLSSTSANEPGKEDRVLYGYDKSGTAIYIRLPTGKIGEEFIGWATSPLDMLKRKESTFLRPIDQTLHNDLGFGRRVYNPDDPGVAGAIRNVGKIVSNAMLQQVPNESIQAMIRGAQGTGTDMDAYKVLGPLFGLTFSRGAPGGPAVGEMFKASQERRAMIADNMPDIRQMILAGKQDQAVQKMIDIGMTQAEIKLTLTHVLNPAARLTPGALKRFEKTATDEQKEKMRQLQSH